jgi:hypothetical protein
MLFQMLLMKAAPVDEISPDSYDDELDLAVGTLDVDGLVRILMRIAARKPT